MNSEIELNFNLNNEKNFKINFINKYLYVNKDDLILNSNFIKNLNDISNILTIDLFLNINEIDFFILNNLLNGKKIEIINESLNFFFNFSFRLEIELLYNYCLNKISKFPNIINIFLIKNQFFDGIFNYLTKTIKNNIYHLGIIDIKSTYSQYQDIEDILPPGKGKYWYSISSPNSFIQFNFKNKKIKISNYSLRNNSKIDDFYSPSSSKSWVLLGSNDENSWDIIDEQRNNFSLFYGQTETNIQCFNNNFYQFIKIINLENHKNYENYFLLSIIEFFGEILN